MSSYKVGYAKPPKDSQWKTGQSGNPKGRPKKKRNHLIDAYTIATEPVKTNSLKSPKVELSPLQAGLLIMCKEALSGKRKPLFDLLKLGLDHLERINFARIERKNEPDHRLLVARAIGLDIIDGDLYTDDGKYLGPLEDDEEEEEENDY
ncbi:hypothetical protein HY29_16595 [Hyphomonas beringensis]|uniref:DUF5681 domain-containing protein n=1 Tax=Hyphomonas beringensis TaxID=1280946 RepID=A0A062U7C4_9PROT|nr:DUF5681 domain-containing protein [Hyphomonas beringensis]KCZ53638.1 hypothetical protein HY29_16595 [Hyphomonas beringensis]